MAEGPPVPPPGGDANQEASLSRADQPAAQNAIESSEYVLRPQDEIGLADYLEKAGLQDIAQRMRQNSTRTEEIAQQHHRDHEAWVAHMDAEQKAKEHVLPPSLPTEEDKVVRLNSNEVADIAEQQKKHTLVAKLRQIAKERSIR